MLIPLLLVVGCVGQVEVDPSVGACTNYDFDDPPAPSLESSVSGDAAEVWRTYVERPNSDDVFAPNIEGDGTILTVEESWEAGTDGVPFCMEPKVTISGLSGMLTVQWYDDDASVPFDTVDVAPE